MRSAFAFLAALGLASAAPAVDTHRQSCHPPAGEVGAVFAMTNAAVSNDVVAFSRSSTGKLTQTGIYQTGGAGQGVDFDSDGGLQLSPDRRFLYAVSPASDTITVFAVRGSCLTRIQEIYGGDQPVSVTFSFKRNLLYVLQQSVADTGIRGYHITSAGTLTPVGNATIPTSTPIGVPGTVLFVNNDSALIVTNKVGSCIDFYSVDSNGLAHFVKTNASPGPRPFGAVLGKNGVIFTVESGLPTPENAAITTYTAGSDGTLHPITSSAKNQQTDGCWVLVTPNGKWAYTANFVSGTISSYSIGSDGSVKLIKGNAAYLGDGSEPVDLAISADGKFLFNLLRGGGAITSLAINDADGSITAIGTYGKGTGIPFNDGASGLTAY